MTFQPELPFGAPEPTPRHPDAPRTSTGADDVNRLWAGPYSRLAPRLFDEILTLQADDPLRRVEVVLPSHLLGVDLRRRLLRHTEAGGERRGVANVRFETLSDAARALLGGADAGRPAPPSLLFAAVASALETLRPDSPYFESRHRVGFVAALTATLRDLRDAGVGGEAIAAWADRAAPDRRGPMRTLAGIAIDVARRLAPFADEVALFSAATRAAEEAPSDAPLLVFGFYDVTGLQADLLAALARSRPMRVFLPRFDGDLGDYAAQAEAFFHRTLGIETQSVPEALASTRSEFSRRFAAREGGAPLPDDGSIRLVSAADDAHEAREAAREILIGVGEGIPLASCAVLVRSDGDDARRALAALERAGIPAFPLGAAEGLATTAGRALRLWSLLEEDGYRREDVLELLDLLEDARGGHDGALFRLLAAESGIVRGAGDWSVAVGRLAEARVEETEEEGRSDRLTSRRPEGVRAAQRLAALWPAVLEASQFSVDASARSWDAWAADLRRRLGRLYGDAPLPVEVAEALEHVAALEGTGGRVRIHVAVHTLLSEVREAGTVRGRLGKDGVAVLPVMAARGLEFQHTILAGLAERKFPALARPDPLLFDEERASLAEETHRPLPPKAARRPEEERFLFAAALETASRRLTLTTSRRDASVDRERMASQFFDRAVEALGAAGDFPEHPALRRTNLGSTPMVGPALTPAEARARLLQTGGPDVLASLSEPFRLALARGRSRRAPVFGEFEGRIDDGPLRAAVAERVRSRGLSASALQTFAICPHRFFYDRVLSLRAWQDPSERADVDDLTRGQLFHEAARRISEAARGGSFADAFSRGEAALSRAAAESLAAFETESGFVVAPAALRGAVLSRLEGQLRAWLAWERSQSPPRRPIGAEVRFGSRPEGSGAEDAELSTDEPLEIAGLPLRGRIDLLSTDEEGRLHVTDFKVSRTRKRAETIVGQRDRKRRRIFGGELAQLPVYALASEGPLREAHDLPRVHATEFLYIAPPRAGGACAPISARYEGAALKEAVEGLERFTLGTLEAVERGLFLPKTRAILYPKPCDRCDFAAVCGPGHERPFEEKRRQDEDPHVAALFALAEIP